MPLWETRSVFGFASKTFICSGVKQFLFAIGVNSPFLSHYTTSDLTCHADSAVCLPYCAAFAVHFCGSGKIYCPYYGIGAKFICPLYGEYFKALFFPWVRYQLKVHPEGCKIGPFGCIVNLYQFASQGGNLE